MKELDVRGLSCPEPVLLVKNELKNNSEPLKILINEAHTLKNVQGFLDEAKKSYQTSTSGFDYIIEVK